MNKKRARDEVRGIVYIIFNSIPPYAYETNNILALPNDMPYRARFRKEWCPDIHDGKQIEGSRGILVLRNWENAQLMPLRHIEIEKIDPVGDIFHISYILQQLVEFDTDSAIASHQIDDFSEKMALELKPYPNAPKMDLAKLVFVGPDLTIGITDQHYQGTPPQKELDNWGKIVKLIGKMDCFLDIDFLKVIRVADINGKSKGFINANGILRYHLENEKVYSFDVFQRSQTLRKGDSSVSNRIIALHGETDAIKPIKNQFNIVGKYDLLQFRFKTQISELSRDTDLALDINRSDDKGPIPTIFLPIRIASPIFTQIYQIAFLIIFVLGAILLFFGDKLFSGNTSLSQNIGIFIMIVTGYETGDLVKGILKRIKLGAEK